MRYLDPKNDLVFKRVFGQHKDITISLLNALLPLDDDHPVVSIEYLPTEMIPDLPTLYKNTIVDVRCKDSAGRHFIVEMQMIWADNFKSRVLFNASKAYVRQLEIKEPFNILQPVYALNIVNDIFEQDMPDSWYHHYKLVHLEQINNTIDGIQLIFIELPKFKPETLSHKKLSLLWLRYIEELDREKTMYEQSLLEEMMQIPEIAKALELSKESAYTIEELEAYDRYWDAVRTQNLYISDAMNKGIKEGKIEGIKEGIQIGEERGIQIGEERGIQIGLEEKAIQTAKNLKALRTLTNQQIADATGLDIKVVAGL